MECLSLTIKDHREPTPERQAKVDQQWADMIAWLMARQLRMHIPLRGNIWFSKIKPGET